MPKFWSRGLQFIGEKLGREVTEDKDFENLLTKVDKTEKGFIAFRSVIQNFNSYFEKFTKFFSCQISIFLWMLLFLIWRFAN